MILLSAVGGVSFFSIDSDTDVNKPFILAVLIGGILLLFSIVVAMVIITPFRGGVMFRKYKNFYNPVGLSSVDLDSSSPLQSADLLLREASEQSRIASMKRSMFVVSTMFTGLASVFLLAAATFYPFVERR